MADLISIAGKKDDKALVETDGKLLQYRHIGTEWIVDAIWVPSPGEAETDPFYKIIPDPNPSGGKFHPTE